MQEPHCCDVGSGITRLAQKGTYLIPGDQKKPQGYETADENVVKSMKNYGV